MQTAAGVGEWARPSVETGVCHSKSAEARLPDGAFTGLAVRFNALRVPDGVSTLGVVAPPPNLNYTQKQACPDRLAVDSILHWGNPQLQGAT